MNLCIQHHSIRSGDFADFVFTKIQRLAFRKTIIACCDGIHHIASRVTQCAVRRNHILSRSDLIDCTRQPLNRIDWLIDTVTFGYGCKHLAGFADFNDSFLRHIRLCDFHNSHRTFLCRIIRSHIEVNRIRVQHIAIRCRYFYERIAGTIFQLFRRYQIALVIGIKSVDCGRGRIGEGHFYLASIRTINLEASTRIRDCLSGFCIYLNDLDETLKVGVVGQIAINLSVLCNVHIKVSQQLPTIPAGYLMDSIDTIGE